MRTTLTLDPDLHKALLRTAQRQGRPFKQVLNDALRAGLQDGSKVVQPFRQPVFALGRSRVDLTKALALADELADFSSASRAMRRNCR
jgi:hypothetical protein